MYAIFVFLYKCKELAMGAKKDLTARRFDRLVVLNERGRKNGRVTWDCVCDCGNKAIATSTALVSKTKRSCGCLARELLIKRSMTHGLTGTKIYKAWEQMISRCNKVSDKSYFRYGGRGIKVCARWLKSLPDFVEDMGEPPEGMTIDRKDNNKGYFKDNCRWATKTEQARNRRSSKLWSVKGVEFKTCTEAAKHFNVSHQCIILWCKNRSDCKSERIYENI